MGYLEERNLRKQGLAPKLEFKKPKKAIAKIGKKKLEEMKLGKPDERVSLDEWFDKIENEWFRFGYCPCMECGEKIPKEYARHATAHLLPKKIFKSVATHDLNYLILGASCGCHDKTHRIDKFIKMKIWGKAKERILQMMPFLPTDELRRISNQLLIALDMTEK